MRRLVLITLLLCASFANAKEYDLPPEAYAAASDGIKAIYNLNLDYAAQRIDDAEKLYPGHPYAYFGKMMIAWARYDYQYEQSDPQQKIVFEGLIDDSIKGINAWLKTHPKDPHAFMALGGAYGLRSRFAMANRSWISAYFSGKKGINYMQKAVDADPEFYDAYLGLGMYEYYAGTLPSVIKVLSTIVAAKGSPKKGVEYLTLTKDKGTFASDTARLILVEIYNDRNSPFYDPAKALQLIREVRAKYPANPLMNFVEIIVDYENKNYDKVILDAGSFYSQIGVTPFYSEIYRSRAFTAIGTAYMAKGNFKAARKVFEAAFDETLKDKEPSRWAVWNELRLGETYDALGERQKAIETYRDLRQKKELWGFDEEPKKYLKKPFTKEDDVGPLPPL